MRIGEFSEVGRVPARAIRHYCRVGPLPDPDRKFNDHRSYGLRDAVLLLRLSRSMEPGLRPDEVADTLTEQRLADSRRLKALARRASTDPAGEMPAVEVAWFERRRWRWRCRRSRSARNKQPSRRSTAGWPLSPLRRNRRGPGAHS